MTGFAIQCAMGAIKRKTCPIVVELHIIPSLRIVALSTVVREIIGLVVGVVYTQIILLVA